MRNRKKNKPQNSDEVLGVWNQTDLDSHPNSITSLLCDLSQVTELLKASDVLFVKLVEYCIYRTQLLCEPEKVMYIKYAGA